MVFVPYQTIHMNESFDFFLLYVFPLVTVCFLVLIWYACTLFSEGKGVVFVLAAAVLILALLLPSIIYTLYFINGATWLRIILGVLFAGISGYAAVLSFPHKV